MRSQLVSTQFHLGFLIPLPPYKKVWFSSLKKIRVIIPEFWLGHFFSDGLKNSPQTCAIHDCLCNSWVPNRDRPRFFDQVGHQTTNASIGNKHFFTK